MQPKSNPDKKIRLQHYYKGLDFILVWINEKISEMKENNHAGGQNNEM